jgi:hypothetical protein
MVKLQLSQAGEVCCPAPFEEVTAILQKWQSPKHSLTVTDVNRLGACIKLDGGLALFLEGIGA